MSNIGFPITGDYIPENTPEYIPENKRECNILLVLEVLIQLLFACGCVCHFQVENLDSDKSVQLIAIANAMQSLGKHEEVHTPGKTKQTIGKKTNLEMGLCSFREESIIFKRF